MTQLTDHYNTMCRIWFGINYMKQNAHSGVHKHLLKRDTPTIHSLNKWCILGLHKQYMADFRVTKM